MSNQKEQQSKRVLIKRICLIGGMFVGSITLLIGWYFMAVYHDGLLHSISGLFFALGALVMGILTIILGKKPLKSVSGKCNIPINGLSVAMGIAIILFSLLALWLVIVFGFLLRNYS